MEATKLQDCATVAKIFQKKLMSPETEGAIIGSMLPSVSMLQVNSFSISSNLTNALDPPIPQEVLAVLANEAPQDGPKADLPVDPEQLINKSAQLGLEWLEKCIPCNLRLKFRAELSTSLRDTFLTILEDLLNEYLKELSFVLNILRAPDVFQDACLLLRSLKDVCIPDLQRMISLFAMMLYRDSVKEIAEFDILKFLITPLFQPIFSAITGLFGQYKALITDPLQCVVANLGFQLDKLKTGGFLNDSTISAIENKSTELQTLANINGRSKKDIDFTSAELKTALKSAKKTGDTLDSYNEQLQQSLGTAVFHLRRNLMIGIVEVESSLANLEAELRKLIGGSRNETTEFLIRQYEKLLLVRMISFISALIQALSGGFNCDTSNPDVADEILSQFFDQYLGPESPVEIVKDPVTNKITLVLTTDAIEPLRGAADSSVILDGGIETTSNPPLIIEASGNDEVDQAVNAIMEQATSPVTVKPKCFFNDVSEDSKIAEFIASLNMQEV